VCSSSPSAPTVQQPDYVHNPYLDGGAYGNSVDANRIGTSALTIGLDPSAAAAVNAGVGVPAPQTKATPQPVAATANRLTVA
jgi:hypothetical protein